jgi:hypothetical protein
MKTIIECEAAFEAGLYKNTENKVENIKSLSQQFGFKIEINPHERRKECDIFFEK